MTREEAIKILKTERYCHEDTPNLKRVRKAYDRAIEALSADAVQGEWVLHDGYYCSNCHYKLQTTCIPQYCPSCGARMKGGAE